jgi:small subunit ribosomal protein S3Ae
MSEGRKSATKIVKKEWLSIKASKFFNNEMLGECYVTGPDDLIGRSISVNLANITGDIRQQSITLKFIINSVDEGAGIADVKGYEMAPASIKRVVRRGSNRLDESIVCKTSDDKSVKIKPMIVTRTLTKSAVHRALRKALIASVASQVKKHTFESLINEILTSKIQIGVKSDLKKIYPLKSVEIRVLETVEEKKDDDSEKSIEKEEKPKKKPKKVSKKLEEAEEKKIEESPKEEKTEETPESGKKAEDKKSEE